MHAFCLKANILDLKRQQWVSKRSKKKKKNSRTEAMSSRIQSIWMVHPADMQRFFFSHLVTAIHMDIISYCYF